MKKQEPFNMCPKCGGNSWLGTTYGSLCKKCGYIKNDEVAPVVPKEKQDKD